MTPTKTPTNPAAEADRLRAAAEEAAERAAEAERAAAEAARLAEERRQADIMAIRRRRLDEFDPDALAAEVAEAQARFRAAVLADDGIVSAFVAWQVLASRRYLLEVEARQAQAALEPDAAPLTVGGPPGGNFAEELQRVIDHAVANGAEDLRDDLQAELDRAGR